MTQATMTTTPETVLTEQDLAHRWHCSITTLRSKRSRGEDMPPHFKVGRFVRYLESDVIKWEKSNYQG